MVLRYLGCMINSHVVTVLRYLGARTGPMGCCARYLGCMIYDGESIHHW